MADTINRIVEQMAAKAHNVWAKWLKYMFSNGVFNVNGSFTIPKSLVEKWTEQMNEKYDELDEKEKKSDRIIAYGYINVLRPFLEKKVMDKEQK